MTDWPVAVVNLPGLPQVGQGAVGKQCVQVEVPGLDVAVHGHHLHDLLAVEVGGGEQQIHSGVWVV